MEFLFQRTRKSYKGTMTLTMEICREKGVFLKTIPANEGFWENTSTFVHAIGYKNFENFFFI
jgi:hypothetical protein